MNSLLSLDNQTGLDEIYGTVIRMGKEKTIDKGWSWIVMMSSFCAHIVHGFFLYGIGILNVAFLEQFNGTVLKTSWASGIFLGLFSLCGPVAGIIINKWSCRVAMMLGSIFMTTGLVISAFVDSLDAVLISFGVLSGLGAGLSYSSSVIVVGFNFERHRNLATGIAVSGSGVGTFAMSPLMQLAKDSYGYTGLCLMCGALSFHHLVFGVLCKPSDVERESKSKGIRERRQKGENKGNRWFTILKEMISLLSNIPFSLLVFSMMFSSFGVYLMHVHFSKLAITQGTSETDAAYLLSISGVCSGISRLLIGFSSNAGNINELLLYSGCFSLLGIAGLLLQLYASSFAGLAVFAVMLGMYSGCCYPLLNTISVKLVGIEHLALAYGIEMFGSGAGSLFGPPISGWLVDAGWSYEQSFMVAGLACLLGGIFGWSIACFDKGKASRTDDSNTGATDKVTTTLNSAISIESVSTVKEIGHDNQMYITTYL